MIYPIDIITSIHDACSALGAVRKYDLGSEAEKLSDEAAAALNRFLYHVFPDGLMHGKPDSLEHLQNVRDLLDVAQQEREELEDQLESL